MAFYRNLDGTMSTSFQIGKNSASISVSTAFPTGGNNGDVNIRYGGSTHRLYQKVSGNWVQLQSTQKQTTTKTANYTTQLPDEVVFVDTTSSAVTITLGTSTVLTGKTLIIKDIGGNAGTNNIGVVGQAGETIDGINNVTINVIDVDYGHVKLISDGTNWFNIT
jgi:hypothetical protein